MSLKDIGNGVAEDQRQLQDAQAVQQHSATAAAVGMDPKGIKRGRCRAEECSDCEVYLYNAQIGFQCQYCGFFPVKHVKLSDPTEFIQCTSSEELPQERSVAGNEEQEYIIDTDPFAFIHQLIPTKLCSPHAPPTEKIGTSQVGPNVNLFSCLGGTLASEKGYTSSTGQKQALNFKEPESESLIFHSAPALADADSMLGTSASSYQMPESTIQLKEQHERTAAQNFPPPESSNFSRIVSSLSRRDLYELCVPSRLPDYTVENIKKNGSMSNHERRFILRWIMWTMYNLQLVQELDFLAVATMAVARYPELQCKISKNVDGVIKSLKDISRNRKDYIMKRARLKQNSCSDAGPKRNHLEHIKVQIQREMDKPNPSLVTLKALLSSCRKARLALAKKQDSSAHLKDFPCFEIKNIVYWEFAHQEKLQISQDGMKSRWVNALPGMIKYFSSNHRKISPALNKEQTTCEVLRIITLPSYFGPRKPLDKRERRSSVIEVFEGETLLREMIPKPQDPPRLIAIADLQKNNFHCHIFFDGRIYFSGGIIDSLVQLVALYHVLKIAPAPDARASFYFVFGVLLQKEGETKHQKFKSVLKALEFVGRSLT